MEVVNLRLRMVATAAPYSPAYREPVPGDGAAACYAERPIHFAGKFLLSPYTNGKAWSLETQFAGRP